MCGRYTQRATPEAIAKQFHLKKPLPLFKPNYNVAPSEQVLAIRREPESGEREGVLLRWGLIPVWAKDTKIGNHCINAKCETVAVKPAFRSALKKRRCLIVADGFYEWKELGGRKQPMWIGRKDNTPFAFAGLWEYWKAEAAEAIESCTVITTEPNALMSQIHNRMPVILPAAAYDSWLDPASPETALKELLTAPVKEELYSYPVSRMVNSPKNNRPELLEPVPI